MYGFSLANHRRFTKFAKLSPCQTSRYTVLKSQFSFFPLQQQDPTQGRIQDFLKGGSENSKKGIWSAAPKAVGICIIKQHFEHITKLVWLATLHDISKNKSLARAYRGGFVGFQETPSDSKTFLQ